MFKIRWKIKKRLCVGLSLLLAASAFAGCGDGFDEDEIVVDEATSSSTAVFDLEQEEMMMDEVYLYTIQCMYLYGTTPDEYTEDPDTYKSLIIEQIEQMKGVYYAAVEAGVELTEEQEESIETSVDNYYTTFGEDTFARYGITRETVTKLFTEQTYATALQNNTQSEKYTELYEEYTEAYEDTDFMTFYYLRFPIYELDEDGAPVEGDDDGGVLLSEAEQAEMLALCEEAKTRLEAGEDAATLAEEYGVDQVSGEQSGFIGAFGDVLNETLEDMKEGETSDIIESNTGYILIYLESENDETLKASYIELNATTDASYYVEDKLEEWQNNVSISEDNYINYKWYDIEFEDVCEYLEYKGLYNE